MYSNISSCQTTAFFLVLDHAPFKTSPFHSFHSR